MSTDTTESNEDTNPQGWGRWGAQDEIGAINLIGPEATARGVACVSSGVALSLATPIHHNRGFGLVGRVPPTHYMLRSGADYTAGLQEREGFGFTDDVISMATHGATHVDALSHVFRDGQMYNGFSASEVTSRGARRLGIDKMPPIVTRGVVVDTCPGGLRAVEDPIHADELRGLLDTQGVELMPGDVLLFRTGWLTAAIAGEVDEGQWPGIDRDCGGWLAEREIAFLGSDNPGVEAFPSSDPSCQVPLHIELIRGKGIYFGELLALDELCASGRSTFLFITAPLPFVGAVGSPIVPVAVL